MAATVQLYGLLDTFTMYARNGGQSIARMGSDSGKFSNIHAASDSYWGLRGGEDLGDGVSVQFRLENAMRMSNGTMRHPGALFDREASIAVSSASWGTVKLGKQFAAVVSHTADPFFFSEVFSPAASAGQLAVDQGPGAAVIQTRVSDAISWQTPSMNGLVVQALYARRNRRELISMNSGGGPANGDTGILATYTSGPWVVAGSYNALRPAAPGSFRTDLYVASAAYVAGGQQTSILYSLMRPTAPGTISAQILSLGSLWQQGSHMFRGSLLYRALNGISDHTIGGMLGYDYQLSKRSSVYTRAGGFKNTPKAFFGIGASVPTEMGASSTVLAFGMTHRF